jgi:sugar phosphate isomerase/epimerase
VKLGLLTACLPGESLEDIAEWAAGHGYRALEVAAWPDRPGRDWEASHLDVGSFEQADVDRVRELFGRLGLELSAVAYYENNLHQDLEVREATHEHLRRCIDVAHLLGVGMVGTFVGRDLSLTVAENLRLGEKALPPLVEYAAARGVRLVVENCPMEGWHPDGYPANLAYSPELWGWLAEVGLWLNYDPSHLVWLDIDPVAALEENAGRVLHVQAKDIEVDAAARNRFGVFGQVVAKQPWVSGWWRYRIPGLGQVDWAGVVRTLRAAGYDGVVSVEHEDPVYSGGPDRVREGLEIAERTLAPLLSE